MFGITDIVAYLIGVVIIIALPGPNSLYCLTVSASLGKKAGFMASLGVLVGDSLLIIATVLGAGTLLKLYPSVFDAIKLIGGAYLAYLGGRLIYGASLTFKNRHRLHTTDDTPPTPKNAKHPFYQALSLSLTNPKAILFFLSFFVQFVEPSYPYPFLSFLILAVILQVISLSYLSLLVVAGKALAVKFTSRPWLVIGSMVGVGLLFIGFAINLWGSQIA